MKKPVDNKLSSKIKQVFDDYEDLSADAGWEKLRQKYPDRIKRPIFLWMSLAAAICLFVAGFWLISLNQQTDINKPVKDQNKMIAKQNTSVPGAEKKANNGLSSTKNIKEKVSVNEDVASSEGNKFSEKKHAPAILPDQAVYAVQETSATRKVADKVISEEVEKTTSIGVTRSDRNSFSVVTIEPIIKVDEGTFRTLNVMEENTKENTANDKKNRKTTFNIFAGSFFNYSEGSENELNFGAGFSSDIRISKNLKFSTGLSLSSNSLSFESQQLPQNASSSFISARDLSSAGILTTITSYKADLLAIDIPVNLKYQFAPESNKFYVSAGLSSSTYLNETYAFQYKNFNPTSGIFSAQAKDQEIKKQLSDFDLARTLNLSFGLSTGFGKTQTISIEPFLKYPLGGLGSENLKFGSTGINLKLHFKPAKKQL